MGLLERAELPGGHKRMRQITAVLASWLAGWLPGSQLAGPLLPASRPPAGPCCHAPLPWHAPSQGAPHVYERMAESVEGRAKGDAEAQEVVEKHLGEEI